MVGKSIASGDANCAGGDAPHLHEEALSTPDRYYNNYNEGSIDHANGVNRGSVWSDSNRLFQAAWTQ